MADFRTDYGTDMGPACTCIAGNVEGEGIWGYQLNFGPNTVTARCVLCGHEETFKAPAHKVTNAAQARMAHEWSRKTPQEGAMTDWESVRRRAFEGTYLFVSVKHTTKEWLDAFRKDADRNGADIVVENGHVFVKFREV
jgi:hypothetical protein